MLLSTAPNERLTTKAWHAFWLLTQIPEAARQSNFSERLWELGLTVSSKPTLLEIVAASTRDRHALRRLQHQRQVA